MKKLMVKIIMAALLLIGMQSFAQAQQYTCSSTAGIAYMVTAASGLSMRAEPDLRSVKLKAVPFGKEVVVCPEYDGPYEKIEGVEGKWLRTFYRGEAGFMFSGFMEAQPEVKAVLPESWTDDDNETQYLGLYLEENGDEFMPSKYEVRPLVTITDTVEIAGEAPYTYRRLDSFDEPKFVFSGIQTDGQLVKGREMEYKFLFPGESVSVSLGNAIFHVYAKGRVLENKTGDEINPISMIKNYELHVRRSGHDGERSDQTIFKMDIPSWFIDGYQGGIYLHWMGDIDNDGELDILLSKANDADCLDTLFFLSSKAEHGHLFKQVSLYRECGGC